MSGIWAIVLAAGESKRMGTPKMLLDFNGRTMIERVIENILNSELVNIIVVLGAEMQTLNELLKNLPVSFCFNKDFKEGMLSSVKCGFGSLPSEYDAVLVFQGDQPFISSGVIDKIIESYYTSSEGIVIPLCDGKRGHPLLIDRKYSVDVNMLDASEGLRALAYRYSDDVLEIETHEPGILRDFDTQEDYKKLYNKKL